MIERSDNSVRLYNRCGACMTLEETNGRWGLGTLSLDGTALGGRVDALFEEDNPYRWEPFCGDAPETLRDDAEESALRIRGKSGYGTYEARYSVDVTLPAAGGAFRLDYTVEAYCNVSSPDHPLYVQVPFFHDAMEFVQAPYEPPVVPPFSDRYTVAPRLSKVPFLLGRERLGGEAYYVGVGYRLFDAPGYCEHERQYAQGCFVYEPRDAERAMRISFPYRWLPPCRTMKEIVPLRLSCVISAAKTQYDCVMNYRALSGFPEKARVLRPLEEVFAEAMKGYAGDAPYVAGKGYRMRAWANSEDLGSYYKDVAVCPNMRLAHMLYGYWADHREAEWARTRALEMADFWIECQNERGQVPDFFNEETGSPRVLNEDMTRLGYLYDTTTIALSAMYLLKLNELRQEKEGAESQRWQDAALKAARYLCGIISERGEVGRMYTEGGRYDEITSQGWTLTALDTFYEMTGEDAFRAARERLEAWTVETFVDKNDYYSFVFDDTSWKPGAARQLKNTDVLDVANLGTYFTARYRKTGDAAMLGRAKDIFAYLWLCHMPVQLKGFKNVTLGLVQEQKIWSTFDSPYLMNSYVALPYLSAVTGDAFFMEFCRAVTQAMGAYQYVGERYPFFGIGLSVDLEREGPADLLSEVEADGRIGVAVSPYGGFYACDIRDPGLYRYVGGADWCAQLDGDWAFRPDMSPDACLLAAKDRVCDARLTPCGGLRLNLCAVEETGESASLLIRWRKKGWPLIEIEGGELVGVRCEEHGDLWKIALRRRAGAYAVFIHGAEERS